MNQEEINIYLSARKLLDILNSSYGQKLKSEKPELFEKAENIIQKYKDQYANYKISDNEELRQLDNNVKEGEDILKIISTDSYEDRKEITEIINESSKTLQDKLFFDPQLFYNKYMVNITSSQSDLINKEVINNDRFKLWFSGSQCVDANGEPLVLYHGTGGLDLNEFDEFTFNLFPASYFAENKSYSDWFAREKGRGGNSLLYKVYLRVLNPIDLTLFHVDLVTYDDFVSYIEYIYGYKLPFNQMLKSASDSSGGMWAWRYLRGGVDWLNLIKSNKEFDGFVYYENNPDDKINGKENITKAWLVFNANQIKSADERNTTFSLQSNSIKMEKGGTAC